MAKVLKFGGSSLATPERLKEVARKVQASTSQVIVLSAIGDTTNKLVEIVKAFQHGNEKSALSKVEILENFYLVFINQLLDNSSFKQESKELVKAHFQFIKSLICTKNLANGKEVLAEGELLASHIFLIYLHYIGVKSHWMDVTEIINIGEDGEPIDDVSSDDLSVWIDIINKGETIVTQGYICRNIHQEIDNLDRGGSDYTATLLGQAIGAEEIQLWKDVDGFYNVDPKLIEDARKLDFISYEEASNMAYYGAKILHPYSILPAKRANIPVRVKNTLNPESSGTLIYKNNNLSGFKGVAIRDFNHIVRLKWHNPLNPDNLKILQEVASQFHLTFEYITNGQGVLSLTISDLFYWSQIFEALSSIANVFLEKNVCLISIISDNRSENSNLLKEILEILKKETIHFANYESSRNAVVVLTNILEKKQILNQLNKKLLKKQHEQT